MSGLTAAAALDQTYHRAPESLRGAGIVQQAVTSTEPHDISELITAIAKVTAALNVHEQALSEWVPNFNAFFASFAAQAPSLRARSRTCRERCITPSGRSPRSMPRSPRSAPSPRRLYLASSSRGRRSLPRCRGSNRAGLACAE